MKIKIATEENIETLAKLDQLMAEEENEFYPELHITTFEQARKSIEEIMNDETKVHFLIKENTETIGFIYGYLKTRPKSVVSKYNTIGIIPKVFVKKEHRRKGYAKKLVQAISKHFKEKGATLITATGVAVKNEGSKTLWDSCGFDVATQSYQKIL